MKLLYTLIFAFFISCSTEPEVVHGCLDGQACNYNSSATIDNNSCEYEIDCGGVCGGTSSVDELGICCLELEKDCANVCEGISEALNCGCGVEILGSCYNIDNTTFINLTGLGLTIFPSEILSLSNLEQLELSDNQLTSIPSEIKNLLNLEYVYLDNNQITSLPSEFWRLQNLTDLNLFGNQLISLPPESCDLINLVFLSISNNSICGELPSCLQENLGLGLWSESQNCE